VRLVYFGLLAIFCTFRLTRLHNLSEVENDFIAA